MLGFRKQTGLQRKDWEFERRGFLIIRLGNFIICTGFEDIQLLANPSRATNAVVALGILAGKLLLGYLSKSVRSHGEV